MNLRDVALMGSIALCLGLLSWFMLHDDSSHEGVSSLDREAVSQVAPTGVDSTDLMIIRREQGSERSEARSATSAIGPGASVGGLSASDTGTAPGSLAQDDARALSGVVVFPDGRPASGARVHVRFDFSRTRNFPSDPSVFDGLGNGDTTDEEGRFSIEGIGPGPWSVRAKLHVQEAVGPGPAGEWRAVLGEVSAPNDAVELILAPPVTLTGIVVDEWQQPVTEFTLLGELAWAQFDGSGKSRMETIRNENGRFSLTDMSPGSWTFSAEAPGFTRSDVIVFELPNEEELTLVMRRSGRLAGRVLDPDGRRVVGAWVGMEFGGAKDMQAQGFVPEAQSDDQGEFSLDGLKPGTGSVVARKDGFAPSLALAYELVEGQELVNLVLTLRRGGTISGHVYDENGKPASGWSVGVAPKVLEASRTMTPGWGTASGLPVSAWQSTPLDSCSTTTDGDGAFTVSGLRPGTWHVQANLDMEALRTEDTDQSDEERWFTSVVMTTVELDDCDAEHVVLGGPPADPVRVHGQVTRGEESLPGGLISFAWGGTEGRGSSKMGFIDMDGRYDVQLVESGDCVVTISWSDGPGRLQSIEFQRAVASGGSFELDLELQ